MCDWGLTRQPALAGIPQDQSHRLAAKGPSASTNDHHHLLQCPSDWPDGHKSNAISSSSSQTGTWSGTDYRECSVRGTDCIVDDMPLSPLFSRKPGRQTTLVIPPSILIGPSNTICTPTDDQPIPAPISAQLSLYASSRATYQTPGPRKRRRNARKDAMYKADEKTNGQGENNGQKKAFSSGCSHQLKGHPRKGRGWTSTLPHSQPIGP